MSRPVARIIDDVKRLTDNGVRELTLIGQNVNAYHGEGPDGRSWPLGRLLHTLAEIPGVARLRYSTSHPLDVEDSLIEAHRDLDALMPFVHLPVQSGSDRILGAMNRRHTAAQYLGVIDRFRAARQDIAFSSDFIVGFPSETEEDFAATLALVTQIGYAAAYSFKYSPRPGTPAADMRETVSAAEMDERLERLQNLIDSQQSAFNLRRHWHDGRCAVRARRAQGRPDRRPHRLPATRACDGFPRHHRKSCPDNRKPGALQPARPSRLATAFRTSCTLPDDHWSLNPCQKAHRIRLRLLPAAN